MSNGIAYLALHLTEFDAHHNKTDKEKRPWPDG